MRAGQVQKTYLAMVRGWPERAPGRIDHRLREHPTDAALQGDGGAPIRGRSPCFISGCHHRNTKLK